MKKISKNSQKKVKKVVSKKIETKKDKGEKKENKKLLLHIKNIKTRDGLLNKFDVQKIRNAIFKAFTTTNEGGEDVIDKVLEKTLFILNKRFGKDEIPGVESIQDIVEESLMLLNCTETAKNYILYREQRRRVRESKLATDESVDIVDEYLKELDWEVKENSNTTYSLQSMNNYIANYVSKKYWLNKIYPPEIRKASRDNFFHIHDLGTIGAYCCGWDLYDLLKKGFGGVPSKIQSKPAKHFRTALGQVVNYFYTLQGEVAGAQAFSNFDTYLAPFIRYDRLNENEIKQALQEFIFNCNVPTRVGFQCLSEDTEILTCEGWKNYEEVSEGDKIKTFNLDKQTIEEKEITYIFRKKYTGEMYNLKNRIQDQLISPKHRVVRKVFNSNRYILEPIEDVLKIKSPVVIPVSAKNVSKEAKISDEQIKLMAWIISEGTIERPTKYRCCYRVSIYQSKIKNQKNYEEIKSLLKKFKLNYSEYVSASLGDEVNRLRLDAKSSKTIHSWFGTKDSVHFIPDALLNMSERQSRLFIDTYLKGDGFEGCKITVTDTELLDALQILCVNAGYGFTVLKRKPTIGTKDLFVLRLIKHQETYIDKIEKVKYSGIIWSVHTDNETVIARRKGKVFITGNTPFTNVTLDLKCPGHLKEMPVVIGGELQKEKYGEFQMEMDAFNKILCQVYTEGDASGRVFTFPIPTYNITKDFEWDNPAFDGIWQMTAKYGLPYFSNFINSEMSPEDARSMCIDKEEELLIRKDGIIRKEKIGNLVDSLNVKFDSEGWSDCDSNIEALSFNPNNYKTEWSKITSFLRKEKDVVYEIVNSDGKKASVSADHLMAVYDRNGVDYKKAKDLTLNDLLITTRKTSDILNNKDVNFGRYLLDEDFAFFLGIFVADGVYIRDSRKQFSSYGKPKGIQISFNKNQKDLIEKVANIIKNKFDKDLKIVFDKRFENTVNGIFNSRSICEELENSGLCKYHNVPQILFNAKKEIIESFLEGFFAGDGYSLGQEIHINDQTLAKELVWLYTLIGIPVTYNEKENSQIIRIQHVGGRGSEQNLVINDTLYNRVPNYTVVKSKKQPFYNNTCLVCKTSIEKQGAFTDESWKILTSDMSVVKIKSINVIDKPKNVFYDIELERNHYFVHSMGQITHNCCRLRLDNRELYKRGGGLFGSNPKTGSLGVVTLNLPRIAYVSKTKKDLFKNLRKYMDLAKDSLEIKRKTVENLTEKGLYPYSRYYLQDVKTMRGSYWANHFSTIGLVGGHEMALNFIDEGIDTKAGQKFVQEVLDYMRGVLIEYQKDGGLYNLEATPAEGTSYRLARIDKKDFPDILTSGNEKTPYYTNSTQMPVNYSDDLFEVLDVQDDFQTKYTGGTVLHGFIGEEIMDYGSIKSLLKKVFTGYKLPYLTITPTFSVCPVHGYIAGEHHVCPKCVVEQKCEVYSRVVGYIRPVLNWHDGKKQEFFDRVTFNYAKGINAAPKNKSISKKK